LRVGAAGIFIVMPAKAGIHDFYSKWLPRMVCAWMPAFAGMIYLDTMERDPWLT
jgi:hypothetical protein